MKINFSKYHGTGNDFIIIDNLEGEILLQQNQIAFLCKRHFGIGSDGLMLVEKSKKSDVKMTYYNSDGTPAQMCGNGIRCFAKHVYDNGMISGKNFSVETPAGEKHIEIQTDESEKAFLISVNMGKAIFEPKEIPVVYEQEKAMDIPFKTPWGEVVISAVSMGNPHAVIEVADVDSYPYREIGPFIEKLEFYPEGTNVNFAQIIDRKNVKALTWERGSGLTLACGTGSCAVAVVLHKKGLVDKDVVISIPGGRLKVQIDDTITMTGPAVHVFDGQVQIPKEG
ncbi:diaminopimelate epimerase [Alkalibacter saccharofermentans]|uniref:Diaminopimelate epimerase n=1 Tax=Alkalibacter saccharofermentans DSM 14828 TaxID=1120975 RepID=A0A1M4S4T2_9FIRM|nr:diaminopimelate epimerase [Alkalibacter saccharofermentans]SHE27213.1 diaminopimelate epimerase [Alkalibacter saccharofermentans DSM 14828]